MLVRTGLMVVTIATGAVVAACGGANRNVNAPSTVAPGSESEQSRELPPPGSANPLPPPVERAPSPPRPPVPPQTGTCDAAAAQWAIGQPASDRVLEQARTAAGAGTARFLRPNEPITMEWLGSRLNLDLDGRNVVRSVRCG